MSFSSYIDRILESIPESAKQHIDEEWLTEIEELVREFDIETEEGIERANIWISDAQTYLSSVLENLQGKASTKLAKGIQILVPHGWLYHYHQGDFFESPVKGDSEISFTTVSFKKSNAEYAIIKSGIGATLNWNVSKIPLTERSPLFISSVPAWQIDLVACVPSLEDKISHKETYRRVKNSEVEERKWQRSIDSDNRQSIAEFFDRQGTFFSNPVILHYNPNSSISMSSDESNLEIKLDFFNENNASLGGMGDSRPFVIIDGQHRVRGAANSLRNAGNYIPVIILSDQFANHTTGKIFAEINTLSKPLKDKHRMFLANRFMVKSPELLFTFGVPGAGDDSSKFQRDRANRLTYELASRLSVFSEFWNKRIKILDQNRYQGQVLDIEKWMEFTYDWFSDYPYTSHHPLEKRSQYEEVQNYFDAWGDVIGWENWENSGVNACLFKSKTQARVLLRRFPQIYEIAKQQFPGEDKLKEEHFRKVLRPLENIPFTHEDILKHYNHADRPEVAWQILDIWVKDAIANQAVYSIQDILSENERSVPGKGIISMPAASENLEHTITPEGLNPSDGETRYLSVVRPKNALEKCEIEFWSNGEQVEARGASWKTRVITGNERIPIRNKGVMLDNLPDLSIVVKWRTIRGWTDLVLKIK